MSKRKNGEGSYGKRKINGSTYLYYKFPDGHFVYGKTAVIRDEKIKQYKEELKNKPEPIDVDNPLLTLGEFARVWLAEKTNEIEGATYIAYSIAIEKRLYKFKYYDLANVQLISLTIKMLEDYLFALADHYSKGTVNKSWVVIRQIIKEGMRRGIIPRIELEDVRIPKEKDVKVKQKEIAFITPQDMERLYNDYCNNTYPTSADVVIFIMYSGCRVSEATACKWEQISEDFTSVKIDKAQERTIKKDKKGRVILDSENKIQYTRGIKNPKSEAGNRIIPLPKRAQMILRKMYEANPHEKNDLIFPAPTNMPYDRGSINRMLKKMETSGNCSQHYTPHSLRHGYGSYLLSKGVDIKIVSELLGHRDITTTYNIYIGILKEDKIKAVTNTFDD